MLAYHFFFCFSCWEFEEAAVKQISELYSNRTLCLLLCSVKTGTFRQTFAWRVGKGDWAIECPVMVKSYNIWRGELTEVGECWVFYFSSFLNFMFIFSSNIKESMSLSSLCGISQCKVNCISQHPPKYWKKKKSHRPKKGHKLM